MQVCLDLYLPELGACLQLSGVWGTKLQSLTIKTNFRVQIGGIKTGYVGILYLWMGHGECVFVEDGCCWVGNKMVQSYCESLVKDTLYILVRHTL